MADVVPIDQPGMTQPVKARVGPPINPFDGRYEIPDPITGRKRLWTRATTYAKAIDDEEGLLRWKQRMAAIGFALREDLRLQVLAVRDPESKYGKKRLNDLVEEAKEYALANKGRNLGNALHEILEGHDAGDPPRAIPAPYDRDLAAYEKAMRAVSVSKNYIEKTCIVHSLGVAGTMDRVVSFHQNPLPLIGDVKTGKLDFSWVKISIQLALYAHADYVYDPVTRQHSQMLPVNQEKALVIHLPAGQGKCTLWLVDITAGWKMVATCGLIRKLRNRKDLFELLLEETS